MLLSEIIEMLFYVLKHLRAVEQFQILKGKFTSNLVTTLSIHLSKPKLTEKKSLMRFKSIHLAREEVYLRSFLCLNHSNKLMMKISKSIKLFSTFFKRNIKWFWMKKKELLKRKIKENQNLGFLKITKVKIVKSF